MLTLPLLTHLEKIISFLNDCKGPNFNQEFFEKNTQPILHHSAKIGKYDENIMLTIFNNSIEIDQYEITIESMNNIVKAQITDCCHEIKMKNSEFYLPKRILSIEFIFDIKEYAPELANALGW
jgi:hypothetical protein